MIRNRWLVVAACIALLIAGISSFRKLPIEPYPNVSPLNVQVITQWAGRSTLEVEQQLTIPIETALAGVPDVKAFRSISLFGLSVVTMTGVSKLDCLRCSLLHLSLPMHCLWVIWWQWLWE